MVMMRPAESQEFTFNVSTRTISEQVNRDVLATQSPNAGSSSNSLSTGKAASGFAGRAVASQASSWAPSSRPSVRTETRTAAKLKSQATNPPKAMQTMLLVRRVVLGIGIAVFVAWSGQAQSPLGQEFRVNTGAGVEIEADIKAGADGVFSVAWLD